MVRAHRYAAVSAMFMACALGGDDPYTEQFSGGTASIKLKSSSAAITQTSETQWSLAKTGSLDPTSSTVTWQVTATQTGTVSGRLVVTGTMKVENKGTGGATIGNIVANLQTQAGGGWVTRSSDVADATNDDAATSANVVPSASSENRSFFQENGASGSLLFMDATTNTLFALVPQVTIQPHETKTLLFTATFDNTVLNLADGTPIKTEILVSFGNASPNGTSASNIDINGNGVIDPDEANVRTVRSRFGLAVPPQQSGNSTVSLTDTLQDIATTGTVTFTNAVFNLGATSGTVSARYDGGASGGTITNCAHLTSTSTTPTVNAINLTACDTQTIGPHTCTPGAPGCGWEDGDMVSYSQNTWGTIGTVAASLLVATFNSRYPGGLEVGITGSAGYSMVFLASGAVLNYLPASGAVGALNADLVDPTSSSSGIFGGVVVALKLNVDFSDAHLLGGTASTPFGDVLLCGLIDTPGLNGMSVRQLLDVDNAALGGGSAPYSVDQLAQLTFDVDQGFEAGTASVFAQDHLFTGSCPP